MTPLSTSIYRLALRLLPRGFRAEYGRAMQTMFNERVAEIHGPLRAVSILRLAAREIISVLVLSLRESSRSISRRAPVGSLTDRLSGHPKIEMIATLRYTLRTLRRAPGFAIPATITLALGIGACVTIFCVVRGVVLKPLPYPDAERIVVLDHSAEGIGVERGLGLTRGLFFTYAARSDLFKAAAMYEVGQLTLSYEGVPERVKVARITSSTRDVFLTTPIVGRWFTEPEAISQGEQPILISRALWTRRFGADPSVVGGAVRLQGQTLIVIGVMPSRFRFPEPDVDVWIPMADDPATFGGFDRLGVARLQPGIGPEDASVQLNDLIPTLPERYSEAFVSSVINNARLFALVRTLHEDIVGDIRPTLWILFGSVGFIWLMACSTVANLLLVRAEGRHHEVAVRLALGAHRRHVVAIGFAEVVVLSVLSAAIGLLAAWIGTRALVALAPPDIPRVSEIQIDGLVIGFTILATFVSTTLLGMVSLTSSAGSNNSLRAGSHRHSASTDTSRFRQGIGIIQIAVAVVLLIGSGLMLRTFREIQRIDLGFSSDEVLTFEVGLTNLDYPSRADAALFHQTLTERVGALPGINAVGTISRCLPFGGWCGGDPLAVHGRQIPPDEIPPIVALRTAGPGYAESLGIPVTAGRWIEPRDISSQTNNVVVSQALADLYWPGGDPLGQRVSDQGAPTPESSWYTVIGVVGNVPARTITEIETPIIYYPPVSRTNRGPSPHTVQYAVRTVVPANTIMPSIRGIVSELDGNVPIANVRLMTDVVRDATASTTFVTILLGIAAAMALFLGVIGVYAVISYSVARRQNEIGIRLALGASTDRVLRLIVSQGLALVGLGILAGLGGAFALTRYLESLLYEVTANDPVTYVAVVLILTAATILASYVPARRASGMDPSMALRPE